MAGAGQPSCGLLQVAGLAYLLLFTSSAVAPPLGGKRGGPVRLRENLWATGHFMGKKSALASSHLQSSSLESTELDNIPEVLSPVVIEILEEMKELLRREFLKILLQWRLVEENQRNNQPTDQETPLLRKLLAKYI